MENEKITAWVTQYALTDGIIVVNGEVCNDINSGMLSYGDNDNYYAHGNNWHRTQESAIKRAEEMRDKKICSLKRQITKLENMNFLQRVKNETH